MTNFDDLMSSDQTARARRILRSIPLEIDRAFEKAIKNLVQQRSQRCSEEWKELEMTSENSGDNPSADMN